MNDRDAREDGDAGVEHRCPDCDSKLTYDLYVRTGGLIGEPTMGGNWYCEECDQHFAIIDHD